MAGFIHALARSAVVLTGLAALASAVAAEPLSVESVGRRLSVEDWGLRSVGLLQWRGGLELSSTDERFGGLSGLLVADDGARMLAVSDRGYWLEAELRYDKSGNLARLENARLGPLTDETGQPLSEKSRGDAESLARLPDGSLLVAFEREHRIWRYPSDRGMEAPPESFPTPPGARLLTANAGMEALVAWPDGRLFAAAEAEVGEAHPAYLFSNGVWHDMMLRSIDRHSPTGATVLPSGDLLLVERRFSFGGGLSILLRRLPLDEIRPGARLAGEEIARLAPPLTVDNMEGVAAWREASGKTLIALVSDDNFNPFQRNLLLLFELPE